MEYYLVHFINIWWYPRLSKDIILQISGFFFHYNDIKTVGGNVQFFTQWLRMNIIY